MPWRNETPGAPRRARWRTALLAVLAAALLGAPAAVQAHAQENGADSAHESGVEEPGTEEPGTDYTGEVGSLAAYRGQAAYLAERLAEDPVYISDTLPRRVPLSAAPFYRDQAARADVPVYLMAVPYQAARAHSEALLAAVHDRVGADGVYVLLSDGRSLSAAGYGVDIAVDQAARATMMELPEDASSTGTFEHFMDVLLDDPVARAEAAAERYDGRRSAERQFIGHTDRRNQSFVTGIALTGVPLALIGILWAVRGTTGRGPHPWRIGAPAAGVLAVVIAVAAPQVFDQKTTTDDPLPTEADMTARTDRVAESLQSGPVHFDRDMPPLLGASDRQEIAERLDELPMDANLIVTAHPFGSETAGNVDLFVHDLHDRVGAELYISLDAGTLGRLSVHVYGAPVDGRRLDRQYGGPHLGELGDSTELMGQLDLLLTDLEQSEAEESRTEYRWLPEIDDPRQEITLAPLHRGDFVPGLWIGSLSGPAAGGAVWGVLAGFVAYRRYRVAAPVLGPGVPPGALEAPNRPSTGWLRRTAARELTALGSGFEERAAEAPKRARARAWETLDAATLLLDPGGRGRVDDRLTPQELVTGVALLRASEAALGGRIATSVCVVNPMHGPADATRRLRGLDPTGRKEAAPVAVKLQSGKGSHPRRRGARQRKRTHFIDRWSRPVCAACAARLDRPWSSFNTMRWSELRLPDPEGRGRVPYWLLPGILDDTIDGRGLSVEQLIRTSREVRGVG